jgi:transposase InsO family protein
MYRVLAANAEVRERRNQLRHPTYHKPELLATGPNQVWSWDITKLLGPVKWTYYYLYVLLDSCGAPGYVESRPGAQASVGFRGLRLYITGAPHSASSHARIEASERHAASAGSASPTGLAFARAARFVARSTTA